MATCSPNIEPCDHGLFKMSCACGFKVNQRFRTLADAERYWAKHAQAKAGV